MKTHSKPGTLQITTHIVSFKPYSKPQEADFINIPIAQMRNIIMIATIFKHLHSGIMLSIYNYFLKECSEHPLIMPILHQGL